MIISNKLISNQSPVFIIAELSANHNGSLETALETIRAAKRAGADCINYRPTLPILSQLILGKLIS
jgi:pseudaminic acid synthase